MNKTQEDIIDLFSNEISKKEKKEKKKMEKFKKNEIQKWTQPGRGGHST